MRHCEIHTAVSSPNNETLSQHLMRIRAASSRDTENIRLLEDNRIPIKEQAAEEESTLEERRRDLHKQLFHLRSRNEDSVQGIDQQLSEEEQTIGTDDEVRHYLQGNSSQSNGASAGKNGGLPITDTISSTTGGPLLGISVAEMVSDSREEGEELFIESDNIGSALETCTSKNDTTYEQQEELVEDINSNTDPDGGTQKEHTFDKFTGSLQTGKANWFNEAPAETVQEIGIPQITEEGVHGFLLPNICSCENWTETLELESDLIQNSITTSSYGKEEQSQLDVPVPCAMEEVKVACVPQENYSNIHTETTEKDEEDISLIEKISPDGKASEITVNTTSQQEDYLWNTCAPDAEGSTRHDTVSSGGQNRKESSEGTAYTVYGVANYAAESQLDVEPTETCFLSEPDAEYSCPLINALTTSPRDCYDSLMASNDPLHSDSLLHETEDVYFTQEGGEKSEVEQVLELADMKYDSVLETGSVSEEDVHIDDQNTTETSTSNRVDSRNVGLSTPGYSLKPAHYHAGDNSERSEYVIREGLKCAIGDNATAVSSESQYSETESNTDEIQPKKEECTILGIWAESSGSVYNPLLFSEESVSRDKYIRTETCTNPVIEKSNEYAIKIMSAAVQEITHEKRNVALLSEPTEKKEVSETQETYTFQVPDKSNVEDQQAFGNSTAHTAEQLQNHNIDASQVQLETIALPMSHIEHKQETERPATVISENTVLGLLKESVPSVYTTSSEELLVSEEVFSPDDHVFTEESTNPFTVKSYDYVVETMLVEEEEIALGQLNLTLPSALRTETLETVSDVQETYTTRVPNSQNEISSRNDMKDQPAFDSITANADEQFQTDGNNGSRGQLETATLHINHIFPKQGTECPAIVNEEVFDHDEFTKDSTNQEPVWESPAKYNESVGTKIPQIETEHLAYASHESCLAPSSRDYDPPCSVWHDNVCPSITAPSKTNADTFDHEDIQSSSKPPTSSSITDMDDVSGSSKIAQGIRQMGVDASCNDLETKREIPLGPVILISEAVEERYEIIYAEETMASEPTLRPQTEEQLDTCQPLNSEAFSAGEREECDLSSDSVILKRVGYTVFYFLIFVILAVIIYQCDLTVCCILYLFSLYWLCWERGTNKESLKKD